MTKYTHITVIIISLLRSQMWHMESLLWHMGSLAVACRSVVETHGLSCSAACEILVPPTRDQIHISYTGRQLSINGPPEKSLPLHIVIIN